jgi:hypothetical protein
LCIKNWLRAHGEKRLLQVVGGLFCVQRGGGRACDMWRHVQRPPHDIPFASAWGRARGTTGIDIQRCDARREGRDVGTLLANREIDVP